MMKEIARVSGYVLIIAVIVMVYFNERKRTADTKYAIQQIDSVRYDIVRLDSLARIRDRLMRDSIKKEISKTMVRLQTIESVNQKLQKQNEKLDRIYRSITVDLPDL